MKLFKMHGLEKLFILETLEQLHKKQLISRFQVDLLNAYLSNYTIEEMNSIYHLDTEPYLSAALRLLATKTGYRDDWFIKRYINPKQSKQAETALITLSNNLNELQAKCV